MNINEIIKNRRATPPRFLAKKELDKEIVLQLLENANWAPNHKKTEPWRFKIYTGEAKQKLAVEVFSLLNNKIKEGAAINPQKVEKLKNNLERVPVVILIVLQRDEAHRIPEWEEIAAVSMAVQNMWLTATELGLGAFWATPQFLSLLGDILKIETGQKALGFFYIGHMALDYPSPGRGSVEEKVEWM
jgi:nitroreductase